jgi:multimeric flavodoxin WrbA
MKALILLGNTREKSNTAALAGVFADELIHKGFEVKQVPLREMNIKTCIGCDVCHGKLDTFGCVINDDMHNFSDDILEADLVVFASPIYTWMPTPPLKAVMDRMYAFTKYPEDADEFNLMKKQMFAMIATSGDNTETNCDLFDETVRRMAKFAKLTYHGYIAAQDFGEGNIVTPKAIEDAKEFAEICILALD